MGSIPFDLTFQPEWWHKHAGINFSEDFFTDFRYRIEQDLIMRKALYAFFGDIGFGEKNPRPRPLIDTDLIAGEYFQALLLGCEIRYSASSYPETIPLNLSDTQAMELEYTGIESNPIWMEFSRQINTIKQEYGYVESYLDLHGVQNLALDIRGQQLFIDYYEKPEIANNILSVCTDLVIEVGKRIRAVSDTLSVGVTSIVKHINPAMFVASNCTVEMVSNDVYEEFLLPCDRKIAKEFDYFGIHHCGQSTEHVVPGYAKVGNLSFLEVGAFSNIALVRETFPDLHLNLRYSPVRLKNASMSMVREDLLKMLEAGKPLDKVSISCVGIDPETEMSSVAAFIGIMQDIDLRNKL